MTNKPTTLEIVTSYYLDEMTDFLGDCIAELASQFYCNSFLTYLQEKNYISNNLVELRQAISLIDDQENWMKIYNKLYFSFQQVINKIEFDINQI